MSGVPQQRWMLGALLLAGMALGDQTVELPRDETKSLIDAHAKAREKIDEAFAGPLDVQALMCTPPSLVGFVQKSENLQIPDSFDPTDIELDRFRAARVPIFDSCQIWLSDKYRFVYLRQPKSSSKIVLRAVRKDICRRGACLPDEFRLVELSEYPKFLPRLKEYFVFTFVRNPWTRSLSVFSMFHQHFLFKRPAGPETAPTEHCGVPFLDFTEDVGRIFDACEEEECCSYIEPRGTWWPQFVNIHLGDHSHCMFLPTGGHAVDYIGLTESFDESWDDVLGEVSRRLNMSQPLQVRLPEHAHSGNATAAAMTAARRLRAAEGGEAQSSAGPVAGVGAPMPAPVQSGSAEGQVTIWHAVPQAEGEGEPSPGTAKMTYVAYKARVDEMVQSCNSTHTLQFMNRTAVHNLARQYALDLVRLGYI